MFACMHHVLDENNVCGRCIVTMNSTYTNLKSLGAPSFS